MKNLVRALALLSILFAVPAWAGDGVWTPAGPPGSRGHINQVVLDPFSPSTLYLVYFGHDNSGAWKSTDRGGHWTSINPGLDTPFIFSLVPDPFVPGTLWALVNLTTGESLRKSTDGGRTWTAVYGAPVGSVGFQVLAPDPRVAGTLWAWGYDDLFRSRDGGVSWESVARLGATGEVHSLAFHPEDPNVLYVAGGSSLWKSTDSGAHWTAVSKVDGFGFDWIKISPSRPETLYARPTENFFSTQAACVRSDDGGLTWISIPFPNPDFCYSLVVDPGDYLKLWSYSGNRLYTSENGGATWAVREGLPDLVADLLRRDPITGFLYTIGLDGPVRSTDGGATWEAVKQGITQVALGPILAVPGRQTALLASVRFTSNAPETPLLRSRNRGRFWKETSLENVTALARDPRNPLRVLASTFSALHESRDGGATWTRVGTTPPDAAASIAIHPTDSRRIYIGTRNSGVIQSRDGGRTWQVINNGLVFPEPCDRTFCPELPTTDLTIDPNNPSVLHALFLGTLVRSLNGGRRWTRIGGLEEGSFIALARDPRDSRILYAAGMFALFKSVDGGLSWSRTDGDIETPDPNEQFYYQDLAFDPRLGGILYASSYSRGVLRSRDGGATWEPINAGLPLLNVPYLEIDPDVPGGLFAVSGGAGIWAYRGVP